MTVHKCPAEPYITIYLILFGVLGFVHSALLTVQNTIQKRIPQTEQQEAETATSSPFILFNVVFSVLQFPLFIADVSFRKKICFLTSKFVLL